VEIQRTPSQDFRNDPRLEALRAFFGKADCPAQHYSDVFLAAADNNQLDWRLLPSISYVESTGGKSAPNNNIMGWDSGRTRFTTPAAAIHAVGYRLAHSRLYRAKNLDQLLATYNPNAAYGAAVKAVMRRIAPEQ
jgi:hypothetical protein